MALAAALCVACLVAVSAAPAPAPSHKLAPDTAPAPGPLTSFAAKTFDWGRPCTLVTTPSDTSEILSNCTSCGSGNSATPEPTCTFNPQIFTVGQYIDIFYHSSQHHLYLGPTKCSYKAPAVEVCPNATSDVVSPSTPCVVPFMQSGVYYISDAASNAGETGDFCSDFGANMMIQVNAALPPGESATTSTESATGRRKLFQW